jgi:hypothetical protein
MTVFNVAVLGTVHSIAAAIEAHGEAAGDIFTNTPALMEDIFDVSPSLRGQAAELWLTLAWNEWMHQSPASSFDLPRSHYVAGRMVEALLNPVGWPYYERTGEQAFASA